MGAKHFKPFLVRDTEALLLIDHHQAKVLELHIRLNQPVRANHNIHRAGLQRGHRLGLLRFGPKPREQFHAHGILGHALGKGVKMLLSEHGGGHQHGHLFAGHHRLEHRAYGHLGFTEAHVPADQSIHRLVALHVLLGVVDRLHLIVRFLVYERRLKLALPRGVLAKGMAALGLAHGLDSQQFRSQIAHGFLGLFLCFFPTFTAQRVERRISLARADVFTDQMSLAHRHIQLGRRIVGIACGILDHNALVPAVIRALFRTGKRHYFHAEIPPNAVLHMHHIIALLQLGEVDVERGFHYRAVATFHSARTLYLVPAKHLRIAHHHPAPGTVEESPAQGAERDIQFAAFRFKPVLRPQLLQPLLFARVVAEHEHGVILATPAVELGKKFAPLRIDNLWISHAPFHWTESLQTR